ncbi:MAG TPA: TetR/AcrR family transcriptional regulator [Thermoanaerobaculia bacterium]|nr:TetR/AcrR family transcriptional regulator [Thermoanaerobaculia bacterium]
MRESTLSAAPQAPDVSELSSHDRILRAARQLFAREGYESTTTAAIARAAGTSESQLIKHFSGKEGLLDAIFEDAWGRMGQGIARVLESPAPPMARLRALSEALFAGFERDDDLRTLMLLEGRRMRRRGQIVVLSRGFLQLVQVLDNLLEELRQSGDLRRGMDPQAARSALIGAFEGLLRDRLLAERVGYPAGFGPREMRATFAAVLEGLVCRDGQLPS